jgi:multidrug resistance efflux pump
MQTKKIQKNQRLLAQSQQDMENALSRQDEFIRNNKPHLGSSDDEVQNVVLKAMDILESRMNELRVQRKALASRQVVELTAPFDGVVSQVLHRAGEPVLAGEPILIITKKQPTEIAGYANKKQISLIQKKMAVELIKTREQPQIAIAQIIYVGPEIVQIPQQLWRNPNIPEWGRPFLIQVPSGFEVIPGELVGIRGL